MIVYNEFRKTISKFAIIVCILVILQVSQIASANTITGPLGEADMLGLNETEGENPATYGPQTAIRAHSEDEDGPLIFESGDVVDLYTAPGTEGVDALLFVLTMDVDSLLDPILFDASNFGGFAPVFFSDGHFSAGGVFDEFGFPDSISGIGNGEVNSIRFTEGRHAAVLLEIDGIPPPEPDSEAPSALIEEPEDEEPLGSVIITTPVSLRVDIFGVSLFEDTFADEGGIIINNTPNSGAFGVNPDEPPPEFPEIPEPMTLSLMGIGLAGIAIRRFKG